MQLNSQKSARDTELYVTYDETTNSPCFTTKYTISVAYTWNTVHLQKFCTYGFLKT